MKTFKHLLFLSSLAVALHAQTPTQIDVSRVKNAAQLGTDGKVLASQLPAQSGGSGVSQTAQLVDWQFTRISDTQLSFGASCVNGSPCNVNIGGHAWQFTNGPYLINLANSHSGTIWVYIDTAGNLTVGVPAALTGDISVPTSMATGNPAPTDALLLESWDVTNGCFNSTGKALTAYLSYKPSPLAGTGIVVTTGPRDLIQVDTGSVPRKFNCSGGPSTTLPSGGVQGDICWDFTPTPPAKYVCANGSGCTAAGDWKAF
jgi:hypothetical protein